MKKSRSHLLPVGMAALCAFLLTLVLSDVAIEYMKKGLALCASTVIPSLFPFMVIAELLVSSGILEQLTRPCAKPLRLLFGMDESAAGAFLAGALCGFPVGAATLSALYDKGRIGKATFSRALTFCNNPGSAFVISAVGVSLFGSRQIGILLYCTTLLSALLVGVAGRLFSPREDKEVGSADVYAVLEVPTGAEQFTAAVQRAAGAMLTVSAYVVFFSSLVGCLGELLRRFGLQAGLTAVVFGIFELSSGVAAVGELLRGEAAVVFCGMLLGWSGLSVHFQVMTVCGGRGIRFWPYLLAKGAQGLLCGVLTLLALRFFPLSEDVLAQRPTVGTTEGYSNGAFVAVVFFAATVCPILLSLPLRLRKSGCLKEGEGGHTERESSPASH